MIRPRFFVSADTDPAEQLGSLVEYLRLGSWGSFSTWCDYIDRLSQVRELGAWEDREGEELMADLIWTLNQLAPRNLRFGPHPLDKTVLAFYPQRSKHDV